MFHTSLVIHGRCKIFLFQHGQTSNSSAMKLEVRLIKPFQRKTQNTVKHSVKKHFPSPCQNKGLGKRRWKIYDVYFVHGFRVDYDILYLSTKTEKMYETAIPMGKILNAFLAIHGRCKFIIFLCGQTPSLSAPRLIFSLMEHFQGKAKNTVKHSIKSTFSISIQLNCNWLPGNPQFPSYIYIKLLEFYFKFIKKYYIFF